MNKHVQLAALLFATIFSFHTISLAQSPRAEWSKTFGGTGNENVNNCIITSDGGYVLIGEYNSTNGDISRTASDSKIGMLELDSALAIKKSRTLQITFANLRKARQTSDNGFIVTGNIGPSTTADILIAKLNEEGDTVWTNTIGGSKLDVPNDIIETADGGYIIAGQTSSTDGDIKSQYNGGTNDAWIVKLNSNGKIAWEKCYGGSSSIYGGDVATVIRQTPDGGYLFGGATTSTDGDATGGHGGGFAYGDAWLVKIDAQGVKEWHKTLGGSGEDWVNNFIFTSDGGYMLVCSSNSSDDDISNPIGGASYDAWTVKLNSAGEIEWEHSYGGIGYDIGYDIAQANDGNFFVLCQVDTKSGDIPVNLGRQDSWLIKINSNNGAIIWSKVLGGSASDELSTIVSVSSNDELILSGRSNSSNGDITTAKGAYDWWMLKLRPCPEKVFISASMCANESYDFNGTMLTKAGEYKDTLLTVGGCDSIITLTLHVNPVPVAVVSVSGNELSTESFDSYQWLLDNAAIKGATRQTYTIAEKGHYRVVVSNTSFCSDTSASVFVPLPSSDAFPLRDKYIWNFSIPGMGDQISEHTFQDDLINYDMTGSAYTTSYTMHKENYYADEQRWIGVGKGGSIDKTGIYFVMFFKDLSADGDSVLVYKHECTNQEEAYAFPYPAANTTADHGWNWYVKAVPPSDPFPLRGSYEWDFEIPNMGNQLSVHTFFADSIEYSMTGAAYTTSYNTVTENYNAAEQRWIGIGKGGSIDKTGKYFVMFFKNLSADEDSVMIYKHECASKEEAYTFAYPAADATADHGWNWYVKPGTATGLFDNTFTQNIKVYPNPASAELTIALPENTGSYEVSISGINGQEVLYQIISGSISTLNISHLSQGLYLLKVWDNGTLKSVQKVIKR